ncbi:hypothetical protein SEUCBS139899_000268 [Sporothrix eucalyptigena]|uniref:Methyltransferase domain-containing protein n=1 Tax=Sporothrix eucalyptigena TaxID=1812306 RepID=A0ABP0CS18_9PEZI
MAPLSQAEASQYMYAARAGKYEDSWHPHYAERFVRIVNPHPGQRILDLCCGTGLELFVLAEALNKDGQHGDGGAVIGVDVTVEMLAVAAERQKARPELADRVQLLHHDVTHLETLGTKMSTSSAGSTAAPAPFEKHSFDTIVCSNAFVLFDDPDAVVAGWRQFLKPPVYTAATHSSTDSHEGHESHRGLHHHEPGGKLVIDIPHEAAQRSGITMERVARRLGLVFPSNRSWVTSVNSFRDVLERNGYRVERVVELDHISGKGASHYTAYQADELYDTLTKSSAFEAMVAGAGPGVERETVVRHGKPIFREEFMRDAGDDGCVFVSDTMYVYVARIEA